MKNTELVAYNKCCPPLDDMDSLKLFEVVMSKIKILELNCAVFIISHRNDSHYADYVLIY